MTDFQLQELLNSLLLVLTGEEVYGPQPTDKERIRLAVKLIEDTLEASREKERFMATFLRKKMELQDNPDACKKACDILSRIGLDGELKEV